MYHRRSTCHADIDQTGAGNRSSLERPCVEDGADEGLLLAEALLEYLDDREDYEIAVAASERLKRGEERTYSSAEVRKMLGLDD
jgi:RHH-type rel operon transcriptional repressor/antitoxin RelB